MWSSRLVAKAAEDRVSIEERGRRPLPREVVADVGVAAGGIIP
jgi:hypothetical protein